MADSRDINPRAAEVKIVTMAELAKPQVTREERPGPDGSIVTSYLISDPVSQYLKEVSRENWEQYAFSCASADMEPLRVIPVIVNNVKAEEALLYSGSQIVCMD